MSLKKLLAITLVLAMVLSFMPTYAFASGDDATEEPVSEAAAEEPVVEEDPVVEEEPEAPQEEPETWDAPEDVLPEEPVEEAEVGASGFKFVFKADKDDTTGYTVDAQVKQVTIGGVDKNAYYVVKDTDPTKDAGAIATTMVTKTGYHFPANKAAWLELNGDEFNQGYGEANAIVPEAGVTEHVVVANWEIDKFTVSYDYYAHVDSDPALPVAESNVEYNSHPAVKNAEGGDYVPTNPDGWTFAAYVIINGSTETEYKTLDAVRGVNITDNTTIYLKWAASTETRTVTFVYKDALATEANIPIPTTTRPGAQSKTAADGTVTVTFNVPYNTQLVANSDYKAKPIYNSTDPVVQDNMEPTWTPGGSYTLTDPVKQNETFTLAWEGKPIEVRFKDDKGTIPAKTETVKYGGSPIGFTPTPTEANKDWHWTGWELNGQPVDLATYEVKATGLVFEATWSKNTVKFSYDLNGGEAAAAFADKNVEIGGTLTNSSIPERFGYTFKCWTVDAAGEGTVLDLKNGVTVSEAMTAHAQWNPNKYELVIVANDPETATTLLTNAKYDKKAIPEGGVVATIPVYGGASGTSFDVKELTLAGYSFDGYTYVYYKDDGTTDTKKVAANTTLELDKTMFSPNAAAPYQLVLTAVVSSKFYEVKFVNEYPTDTSLGDVTTQTFQTWPTRATSWRLTTPTMKDGTQLPVGAVYNDLYLNAWKNSTTAWDFTKNVTGNMTLTAEYLPFWTVTFQLRDGKFAEGETGTRVFVDGYNLEEMATLAKENKAVASYLTSKGSVNFELPKATREGYNTLSWMDGTTEFTTATIVENKNLKLTDKWSYEFLTVDYWSNATMTEGTKIGSDEVVKGSTISKRDDPVDPTYAFACWKYTSVGTTPTPNDPEFVFGSTKVTKNLNVYATWTDAEATDGTRNYATLAKAAADVDAGATIALKKNVTLTDAVTVAKNMTFDFGSYSVTGGKFTVSNSATLTIKSGTFNGVAFEGAGTVDLKDGAFLGKQFGDATATLTTFGGKYDAAAARAINGKQLLESDKVLAVTTTTPDSYYRCVEKQTVSFVTVEGTQSIANIFIGKGESPKHAIDEAHAAKVINDAVFKTITEGPEAEGKKFTKWTLGKGESAPEFKYTDTTAYTGGDAVAIANYETTHKVTFKVYGDDGIFVNVVDGEKVAAIPGDVQIAIDAHNAKQGPKAQDVLEGWVGSDGKTVDPTTVKITEDTVFTAKMKAKLVFVKADGEMLALVQAPHGVRYSELKDGEQSLIPAGSWISADGVILDENDFVKGDVTFYPKTQTNDNWNLISYSPDVDGAYDSAQHKVTYQGNSTTPFVAEMTGNNLVLSFTIEAPSSVKESDGYRISRNNAVPVTINAQGGSEPCWAGLSPNKNLTITVSETLTIDEIKTHAKAGTAFEYTYEFYPKTGTAAVENSKFTVSFNPRNLLLTNYTLNPDNPSKELLIKDGVYEYTLKYDLAGGKFTDDTKATSTVEWGTKVVLPANPSKASSLLDKWTVSPELPNPGGQPINSFSGGYKDLKDVWHKEGYNIDGKLYGGAFDENKVFVPNYFIMKNNETLKALYVLAEVNAVAYDNSKDTNLGSFALTTTISDVAALLPKPSGEGETTVFEDWKLYAFNPTLPNDNPNRRIDLGYLASVKADAKVGDFFTDARLQEGYTVLQFRAEYVGANKMTFKNGNDTLLEVKNPYTVTDAKSYYTDEAKALEPTIKLFQYWTATAPGSDGSYDKAPEEYNFSTGRVTTAGVTLYAYALKHYDVIYDANGGKDAPATQTKIDGIDLKLATTVPTLIGRDFLGWAKTATATEPEFKAGDLYKDNANVTLYAVWSTADQVTEFVKRAYSLILGREADQSGLDYWVKGLQDKTFKGGDIVSQFMNSDEYVLANHPNAEAVTAVYKTMLDREPDAEGQAYWVGLLDKGCSYNMIINGFCDSAEFKGICEQYGIEPGTVATERRDVNPELTAFVSRNYKCALNRTGDSFGLNYWAGQLLDKAQTPYEVAHGFVFSEECVARGLNNTQFVTMLYKLYMDREPEADGLAYWVGQLDNKTMTREEVEKGFADSPEFAEIIKSYGL